MKKNYLLCLFMACICQSAVAQKLVKGQLKSASQFDSLAGISVRVKNTSVGTFSDEKGAFQISVPSLPSTLVITSVMFQPVEVYVISADAGDIRLDERTLPGEEIVIAADRFNKKLLDVAVSIERFGYSQIKNSPVLNYNDLALYKKGVDMTTSSLTFKTISTRGFNGSGSTRVNQLVDGMDNQAPGLNFFVGNFVGVTELDVDHVEILPGASSALYGPGGMNGTILITSKNPFHHQGLSVLVKEGISNIGKVQRPGTTAYHDLSFRYAKAIKKFAFKLNAQFIKGTDWLANDTSNYIRTGSGGKLIPGNRQSDPNYDGVNVYGDETSTNIKNVSMFMESVGMLPPGSSTLVPNVNVSRTGYHEREVIDPETKNIKLSAALHYKLTRNIESQIVGYWATGNTIYTGNNRYVLKGINIGQYKLEFRHKDWFLRSYTTQEDAGKAYSATVATQYFNEAWKPSAQWYGEYAGNFVGAKAGGMSDAAAHLFARSQADMGRPSSGSSAFNRLFDSVRSRPISAGGGLFLERSQLWMTEGQYHFSGIRFMNVIAGAGWRRYILNSEGTLFIDRPGDPIVFNETGAYAQLSKELFKNRLTLSFSGRIDKNEDFKSKFTPRATALIKLADDHNIRLSYQTAYRFPSTQQKYIKLDVGDYVLLGGLPWVLDTMNAKASPVIDVSTMQPYAYRELKPESCRSYEIGYKGVFNKKLLVDMYAYAGTYRDFLGRNVLMQPGSGQIYSTVINSSTKVKTYGFGFGLDYVFANASAFFNVYSDVITDVPSGFQAFFNAPRYRVNAGLANSGMGMKKLFGYNVMLRWQDAFHWDGELASGPVPAYSTVDAQVSYKIASIRSVVKLGGSNVFNKYYKNGYGNPEAGGIYYMSIGYRL